MISVQGYKEDKVEIKIHKNELIKIARENNEVVLKDITEELLLFKFIKLCEPAAEFIDKGKYFASWNEYYHGSPIKNHIRELTEEELEIYTAINKIMLYVD